MAHIVDHFAPAAPERERAKDREGLSALVSFIEINIPLISQIRIALLMPLEKGVCKGCQPRLLPSSMRTDPFTRRGGHVSHDDVLCLRFALFRYSFVFLSSLHTLLLFIRNIFSHLHK